MKPTRSFKTNEQVFLRLDVDHCCFNKYLSYYRLVTKLPIPSFLDNVWATKAFLSSFYVKRMWFFRPQTCPNEFDEPFGVHSTNPNNFANELKSIESKLGKVKYFTRHGFAPFCSGRNWTEKEIRGVEKKFAVVDISDKKHLTVSRMKDTDFNKDGVINILFHPYYLKTHGKILKRVLESVRDKSTRKRKSEKCGS